MTVAHQNFDYFYRGPKGKPLFVPSDEGRSIGEQLKALVEEKAEFEPVFSHYRPGGHVAALHAHRENQFFAKLDLKNFFYSIARNRVGHALYEIGVIDPGYYARWSTVKNPYVTPSYSLPYGFVQSPALATLVLRRSQLCHLALELAAKIAVSFDLDDISISAGMRALLLALWMPLWWRRMTPGSRFILRRSRGRQQRSSSSIAISRTMFPR